MGGGAVLWRATDPKYIKKKTPVTFLVTTHVGLINLQKEVDSYSKDYTINNHLHWKSKRKILFLKY